MLVTCKSHVGFVEDLFVPNNLGVYKPALLPWTISSPFSSSLHYHLEEGGIEGT